MSNVKPKWLDPLLSEKFFDVCNDHQEDKENEKNHFCLDCCKAICTNCSIFHQSHQLLKVRQSDNQNVLKLEDAEKFINCVSVQHYISDSDEVVHLNNKKPLTDSTSRVSADICQFCDTDLLGSDHQYCSIACKFKHMMGSVLELASSRSPEAKRTKKMSNDLPKWLDTLLSEKYFDVCIVHREDKNNEKTHFCFDCCKAICTNCSKPYIESKQQFVHLIPRHSEGSVKAVSTKCPACKRPLMGSDLYCSISCKLQHKKDTEENVSGLIYNWESLFSTSESALEPSNSGTGGRGGLPEGAQATEHAGGLPEEDPDAVHDGGPLPEEDPDTVHAGGPQPEGAQAAVDGGRRRKGTPRRSHLK